MTSSCRSEESEQRQAIVASQAPGTAWKHFPHYWHFVRGSHRWSVDSPDKRPEIRSLDDFCCCCWLEQAVEQSVGFLVGETPYRSYDVTAIRTSYHLTRTNTSCDVKRLGKGYSGRTTQLPLHYVNVHLTFSLKRQGIQPRRTHPDR